MSSKSCMRQSTIRKAGTKWNPTMEIPGSSRTTFTDARKINPAS